MNIRKYTHEKLNQNLKPLRPIKGEIFRVYGKTTQQISAVWFNMHLWSAEIYSKLKRNAKSWINIQKKKVTECHFKTECWHIVFWVKIIFHVTRKFYSTCRHSLPPFEQCVVTLFQIAYIRECSRFKTVRKCLTVFVANSANFHLIKDIIFE